MNKEAIVDYDKAILINPKYETAYNNRGLAKSNQLDYNGAILDYNKAIELDPNNANIYNNRGKTKYTQQDYLSALVDFAIVIDIDPKNAEAYCNRGIVKFRLGKNEEGCSDLNKAVELGYSAALEVIKTNCQ